MSIRKDALKWYETKYGRIDKPVYTSKYYKPEESWPKISVWWFQFSKIRVNKNPLGYIILLCQVASNKNNFHFLKVPSAFFINHLNYFHFVEDKISFYLSTDPNDMFVELRGKGRLDFSKFLVN